MIRIGTTRLPKHMRNAIKDHFILDSIGFAILRSKIIVHTVTRQDKLHLMRLEGISIWSIAQDRHC